MNFPLKLIVPFLAACALVIVGGMYLAGGPEAAVVPVPEKTADAVPASAVVAGPGGHGSTLTSTPATVAPLSTPASASAGPQLQDKAQILDAIQEITVTYDPQELPKLQPYLLHADPEIRQAARQGMVDMGDAAAAPLLRSAAQLALSPQEAVALNEAADYLELPSASLIGIKTRRPALLKKSATK